MAMRVSRRNFLKSLAGVAGAALVSGTLGACKGKAPEGGEGAKPAGSTELAAADLKVWTWWPDPVEPVQQMAATFTEANPKVKVSVESPADYWTKMQTALAGGAGPDIFFMNNVGYYSWANKGVLLDLTDLASADAEMQANIEGSWKNAVEFYNYKGKQFGLPYMYTTNIIYYNEDYFTEKGLTPLAEIEDDWDWNDYRDIAKQLFESDGDTVTMYGTESAQGMETGWINFLRGHGGDFLNEDSTECIMDSPEAAETFEFLLKLVLEDKVTPSTEALQAENTRSMFMTGKLPMMPGGSWVMNTLNAQLTDFTYNIALFPKSPKTGKRGGCSNIIGLVVNKDTEAKDQSWALLRHLMGTEQMKIMAKANVLPPANNEAAEMYFDPSNGPANRMAAFDTREFTTALPTHEVVTWGEMYDAQNEWVVEMWEGRMGVQEGLANIAKSVNDLFEKAGS